jgi:hypothetical protein
VFVPGTSFQLSLVVVSKARAYLSGAQVKGLETDSPTNIGMSQSFGRSKRSSLFVESGSGEEKKFYNIDIRDQCY